MSCSECGQHYARSEDGCCPHCHFKPKPAETAATTETPASAGAATPSATAPADSPRPHRDGAREFERRGCLGLSVALMLLTAGAAGLWVAARFGG